MIEAELGRHVTVFGWIWSWRGRSTELRVCQRSIRYTVPWFGSCSVMSMAVQRYRYQYQKLEVMVRRLQYQAACGGRLCTPDSNLQAPQIGATAGNNAVSWVAGCSNTSNITVLSYQWRVTSSVPNAFPRSLSPFRFLNEKELLPIHHNQGRSSHPVLSLTLFSSFCIQTPTNQRGQPANLNTSNPEIRYRSRSSHWLVFVSQERIPYRRKRTSEDLGKEIEWRWLGWAWYFLSPAFPGLATARETGIIIVGFCIVWGAPYFLHSSIQNVLMAVFQ